MDKVDMDRGQFRIWRSMEPLPGPEKGGRRLESRGAVANGAATPGFVSEPCSTLAGMGILASEKIGKSCNADKEHNVHKNNHDRTGCRS